MVLLSDFLQPGSLRSYLEHGHEFHLWCYEPVRNLPELEGLRVRDATGIVPSERVFRYSSGSKRGSVAGFSDIFRYALLWKEGGWWVDMDTVCLRPLDLPDDHVFRTHFEWPAVFNLMKALRGSELMRDAYHSCEVRASGDCMEWGQYVTVLCDLIAERHMERLIRPGLTNDDESWKEVRRLFYERVTPPPEWYVLHLCNEYLRARRIDKYRLPREGTVGNLLDRYGIREREPFGERTRRVLWRLAKSTKRLPGRPSSRLMDRLGLRGRRREE